jgi:hypothetical protein
MSYLYWSVIGLITIIIWYILYRYKGWLISTWFVVNVIISLLITWLFSTLLSMLIIICMFLSLIFYIIYTCFYGTKI